MNFDIAGVTAATQKYMQALHACDPKGLQEVFLPEAHLYASNEGKLRSMDMTQWMDVVNGRTSPASQGLDLDGRIVSIDFSGPDSAMAKVEIALPPTNFTDYLAFLRIDGEWRVIAKTFHAG